MSFEQGLSASLWRLDAQTHLVADLASGDDHLTAAMPSDLQTWPADHRTLAAVLHDELTSLSGDLDAVERESTEIDDRQRDAISDSTALDDQLRSATTELAVARERLLHVAVAAEAAEEIEARLSRRIALIRTLLG